MGKPTTAATAAAYLGSVPPIRHWANSFYVFNKSHFQHMEDGELRKDVHDFVSQSLGAADATAEYIKGIVEVIQHDRFLSAKKMPPFWLNNSPKSKLVVMRNGILDLDKLCAGDPNHLLPHTPDLFSVTALPFAFDPAAICPVWDGFMEWLTCNDQSVVDLLHEFPATCLFPGWRHEKSLWLIGQGRNGKSVYGQTIMSVLGEDNCSTVPLDQLGNRFSSSAMLGKLLNICFDQGELGDRVSEGHFKMLVSQDPMPFEHKFKPSFKARPTVRSLNLCNSMWYPRDKSLGVVRRILLVPCMATVAEGCEDFGLIDRLSVELSGIFNRIVAAAQRFIARGRFAEPLVCKAAIAELILDANTTRAFLEEEIEEAKQGWIPKMELYTRYREWMAEHGNHGIFGYRSFVKELMKVFPGAKSTKRGSRRTARVLAWDGLTYRRDHWDDQGDDDEQNVAKRPDRGDAWEPPESEIRYDAAGTPF